jgi:glycine oxidase
VIIGGGVIGCASAFYLAKAGIRCAVLERAQVAAEASSGAGGLLSTLAHVDEAGPYFDLKRASRALFDGLAPELLERTDIDIEFRALGHVVPAFSQEEAERIRARVAWQAARGLPAEWLAAADARALEPGLPPATLGAGWFREDHHVNNTALTQALAAAAMRMGAAVRTGVTVTDLVLDGARVTGVRTGEGTVEAGTVVLAAGAWSCDFEKAAGVPVPVLPAKGQIVVARLPSPAVRHVVYGEAYVIPRASGEHILGSTVEYVGYDKRVTVEGLAGILGQATALVPALREAEMAASWGCLRPATPDALPMIGPLPGRPGLLFATGHFRNGILLGPITGQIVTDLVATGRSRVPIEPFRPDRVFSAGAPPDVK